MTESLPYFVVYKTGIHFLDEGNTGRSYIKFYYTKRDTRVKKLSIGISGRQPVDVDVSQQSANTPATYYVAVENGLAIFYITITELPEEGFTIAAGEEYAYTPSDWRVVVVTPAPAGENARVYISVEYEENGATTSLDDVMIIPDDIDAFGANINYIVLKPGITYKFRAEGAEATVTVYKIENKPDPFAHSLELVIQEKDENDNVLYEHRVQIEDTNPAASVTVNSSGRGELVLTA